MIDNNILPYMRKDTSSTLLTISATAIALLLLASPLLLSNTLLLQPVQAQTTTMTFQTPIPANGTDSNGDKISLTFYAQGTPSTSNPSIVDITNGTFHYEVLGDTYTAGIASVSVTNNTSNGHITIQTSPAAHGIRAITYCSTSDSNTISLTGGFKLNGPVECTSSQGGGDTTQSIAAGSSQDTDGDRDGIPDSSDKCPHNSHHRCFKEDTATTQQQPSSNRTGNQTR